MAKKLPFPNYIQMYGDDGRAGTCLRITERNEATAEYSRYGGAWGVTVKRKGKEFVSAQSEIKSISNKVVKSVSEAQWREDEGSYAPSKESLKKEVWEDETPY